MRFRSLPLFLLLAALLAGCDSTTPSPPEQFPNLLQRGDAWTYDVRFTERPVDSSAVDTLFTARVRMEVTKTGVDLGRRSGLVELTVFPVAAPDSVEHTWYQQSPDSLVDVAYTTPLATSGTLPLTQEKEAARPLPVGRGLTGLPLLVRRHRPATSPAAPRDTVVRTDSRVVLRTPLDRGATWTSFRDPFLSVRTVVGDTTVDTPAGRFNSVEVETALPNLAPTLHWADYVGAEGLVRRVVTDTLERRDETGRPVGPVVSREVYTLTAYRE
jgi:hypothetical protein